MKVWVCYGEWCQILRICTSLIEAESELENNPECVDIDEGWLLLPDRAVE